MTGRGISRKWLIRGLVVAVVVLLIVFRDELPSFSLEKLIEDLSAGLGAWTYLLVGGLAFLETGAFVGLVAPGEFTVLLGGAVASQGDISLPLIIAITWVAAYAGDTVSFMLGAHLGREFLVKHGERLRITKERLAWVDGYFARHGGATILIGRFIGLVRALAPFIAGSSNLPYRRFAPFSILGTGLWATSLILLGYFFGRSLDKVASLVGTGLIVFGVVVGAIVALVVAWRFLRVPENRERLVAEMERRRALRPLLRLVQRVRPQLAFFGRRLTPGGLGLELTTLLAVVSVALFVLISFWMIVAGDPAPTPGDRTALDVANDLQTGWLVDLSEGLTYLGSGWVTWPLAALAAVALAMRRRWMEAAALIVAMVLIILLVHGIKDWTDRPRPPDPLVDSSGSAFPSGHAAYSVLYAWLAVTVALRGVRRVTKRGLLIAAGIALTVLIGLTRVYLRVHWLSDVTAGWALGASCFAAVAAVVLVIGHIRDNPPRHERGRQLDPGASAGAGH